VPVAQPDPADARGQALERDALARHVEPLVQVGVVRKQLLHLLVGLVDVFRVARQRTPAERADALAEQRADIGRHEAGKREGVFQPLVLGDLADVVAVIERGDAGVPEVDHRLDVVLHAGARGLLHRSRITLALVAPFGHRPALRQVTVDRVMRRGLVGHDVRVHAALTSSGNTSAALPSRPTDFASPALVQRSIISSASSSEVAFSSR
jgi:hypothetical protein